MVTCNLRIVVTFFLVSMTFSRLPHLEIFALPPHRIMAHFRTLFQFQIWQSFTCFDDFSCCLVLFFVILAIFLFLFSLCLFCGCFPGANQWIFWTFFDFWFYCVCFVPIFQLKIYEISNIFVHFQFLPKIDIFWIWILTTKIFWRGLKCTPIPNVISEIMDWVHFWSSEVASREVE